MNKKPSIIPELACVDYKTSLVFYTQKLGFKILYTREDEGFAMLEHEGSRLMIDQIGQTRNWATGDMSYPLGRGINFQIEVTNVTALYEHFKQDEYPIFLDLEEKWYRAGELESGNKQFCVQDPDGYLLRFFEDLGERNII